MLQPGELVLTLLVLVLNETSHSNGPGLRTELSARATVLWRTTTP
jgi:hypothetical protein